MIIKDKLLEPYCIEMDENSFNVIHPTGKMDKNGYEVRQTKGYFMTLESAIHKIIKLKLASDNSTPSLSGFIKQYETITNKLIKSIKL